jgi:hypothetical protein
MRSHPALVLRLVVLLAASAPLPAAGQILYTWPGSPFPCDTTLQACVDAAGPDDGVEIATNGPIDESITNMGSLDLRAAPGFQPVFADGRSISLGAADGAGDQFIRVEGLTLTNGRIIVGNVFDGALTVQILDNTVLAFGVFATITVSSSSAGPLVFLISGNDLSPSVTADQAIRVFVQNGFGTGDVVDNDATMAANPDATAIQLDVEDGALVVDVTGNRVVGAGFEHGIRHRLFDAAVLDSRVLGNLVTGASADGAGISVEGFTSDAILDARIVNNTLFENTTGIRVNGVDALIANNIVSSSATGLLVSSTGVSNHHNLFFDNLLDVDGVTAGAGSVFDDPRFAGAGDFRLAAGSPAIDAGDSAAVPPELATDLDGEPRIAGQAVDIGAYEAPEPPGTLAALAALLALALRARSRC